MYPRSHLRERGWEGREGEGRRGAAALSGGCARARAGASSGGGGGGGTHSRPRQALASSSSSGTPKTGKFRSSAWRCARSTAWMYSDSSGPAQRLTRQQLRGGTGREGKGRGGEGRKEGRGKEQVADKRGAILRGSAGRRERRVSTRRSAPLHTPPTPPTHPIRLMMHTLVKRVSGTSPYTSTTLADSINGAICGGRGTRCCGGWGGR